MWSNNYKLEHCFEAHSDWVNDLVIYNKNFLISCSDDSDIKVLYIYKIANFLALEYSYKGMCLYAKGQS